MLCVLQIVATSCLRCGVRSDNLSAMAKMALGKGLSALIAAQPAPAPAVAALPDDHSEKIWQISLDSITPSPLQPRKEFGPSWQKEFDSAPRLTVSAANVLRPRRCRLRRSTPLVATGRC